MKRLFATGLLLLFPFLSSPGIASESADLQQLMTTWLNLESQRGKLTTDWNERRQVLQHRLTLLEREAEVLEEMLAETSEDVSEVDERRQQLTQEQQTLEKRQEAMRAAIEAAIIKLDALSVRIPPPLQEEWSTGLAQVKRDEMNLSEKLEKILSLSKTAEQFERRIAIHHDVMSIAGAEDSKNVQVTQLYLGLSQGWYVSSEGDYYGYGYADANGWHWQHLSRGGAGSSEVPVNPEQLLRILAMIENPTQAEFVTLPVKH